MVKVEYQLTPPSQWPKKIIECTEEEWKNGTWKQKERYNLLIIDYNKIK